MMNAGVPSDHDPAARAPDHSGNDLLKKLLHGGLMALILKLGAAGLSFGMFVVLARAMSTEEFGAFGFGFSAATLLATLGSFGQRNLVLRFAPAYIVHDSQSELTALLRHCHVMVLSGCTAIAILLCIAAAVLNKPYIAATGLLTLAMGLSEFQPNALRAFGKIFGALFPRDILWRVLVITAALPAVFSAAYRLTATQGLLISGGLLLAICLFQLATSPLIGYRRLLSHPTQPLQTVWNHAAWGLWGTSLIQMGAPTISVIVVGVLLSPQDSGPFFAAVRSAMMMQLFLMAVNIIAAPMISRYLAHDDRASIQKLCKLISIGVSVPSLAVAAVFALYGDRILMLFGEGFAGAHLTLVVLSVGYLANAMAGPTMQLMEMSGNERTFLAVTFATAVAGLALMVVLGLIWSGLGVAIAMTVETVAWNLYCVIWIRRRLGISTVPLPIGGARP